MDADSGKIYHNLESLHEHFRKQLTPLPNVNEVLEIRGCNFVVTGYNEETNEMTLRGISKAEAKRILMGGKL